VSARLQFEGPKESYSEPAVRDRRVGVNQKRQEVSNVAMINLIRALCRSGALAACFGLLLLAGCASAELPVYQDDPH
jgi:hypothetical protein